MRLSTAILASGVTLLGLANGQYTNTTSTPAASLALSVGNCEPSTEWSTTTTTTTALGDCPTPSCSKCADCKACPTLSCDNKTTTVLGDCPSCSKCTDCKGYPTPSCDNKTTTVTYTSIQQCVPVSLPEFPRYRCSASNLFAIELTEIALLMNL
jgi:hypothetical protein